MTAPAVGVKSYQSNKCQDDIAPCGSLPRTPSASESYSIEYLNFRFACAPHVAFSLFDCQFSPLAKSGERGRFGWGYAPLCPVSPCCKSPFFAGSADAICLRIRRAVFFLCKGSLRPRSFRRPPRARRRRQSCYHLRPRKPRL